MTLTFQNVGDEVQVRADALDLVEAGQSLDGNILVAVHLRIEVQVVAEVLPVEGQKRTDSIEESFEDTNVMTCHTFNIMTMILIS